MASQHSFSSISLSSPSRYSSASSSTVSSTHANSGGTTSGASYPRTLTLVANASSQASPPPSPSVRSPPSIPSPRSPPSYDPPNITRNRSARSNLPRQLTLVPREDSANSIFYRPYQPVPSSPTLIETPRESPQYSPPRKSVLNASNSSPAGVSLHPLASYILPSHDRSDSKKSIKSTSSVKKPVLARRLTGGIRPLGPSFLVGLAALLSLFFIISVSMVFVGAADEEDPFKELLDNAAKTNPGVSSYILEDSFTINLRLADLASG